MSTDLQDFRPAVGFDLIQPLVGGFRPQAAARFDISAEFDELKRSHIDRCRQAVAARVPADLDPGIGVPDELRQPFDLLLFPVAAHKTEAGDRAAVFVHQFRQGVRRKRLADVLLQPRTVAARTAVRTARNVHGEGNLVRNLLTHDVVIVIF